MFLPAPLYVIGVVSDVGMLPLSLLLLLHCYVIVVIVGFGNVVDYAVRDVDIVVGDYVFEVVVVIVIGVRGWCCYFGACVGIVFVIIIHCFRLFQLVLLSCH